MTLPTPARFLAVALLFCFGSLWLAGCDKPSVGSGERGTAEPRGSPSAEGEEEVEPQEEGSEPTPTPDPPEPPPEQEPRKFPLRESKWHPPANIPHLDSTSPEMRAKIDKYIDAVFDPFAGRDALDAKEALIAIGKPAFPRILGRMAKARDVITDADSHEERLLESSLKLADEALREIDGWLTAKGKSTLRPGSSKDYIQHICRLHYRRWEMKLKYMDKMPGPHDPTEKYKQK